LKDQKEGMAAFVEKRKPTYVGESSYFKRRIL